MSGLLLVELGPPEPLARGVGWAITGLLTGLAWLVARRAMRSSAGLVDDQRRTERRYDLALRSASDAVWDRDLVTGSLFVSPRLFEFLGCPPVDGPAVASWFVQQLHPEEKPLLEKRIAAHLAQEGALDLDLRLKTSAGIWRWFRMRGTAVRDAAGRPIRLAGTLTDIDEHKVTRQQLEFLNDELVAALQRQAVLMDETALAKDQADLASRSKSEFLANMSHEIRTPMTAILGYSELLRDEGEHGPDAKARALAIDAIVRNGQHLLALLNDILDVSKIEAGMLQVERIACSPRGLVRDVVDLLRIRAEAKGLQLVARCAGPVPETIYSDPTRLKQVLINVAGNAIKFTEHGRIEIEIAMAECLPDEPPRIAFTVVDSGIGMTPEQVARLFQPFMQADASTARKFGGTGLGLTISKRLTALLGGDLTAFCVPGKGCRFVATVEAGSLVGTKLVEGGLDSLPPPPREQQPRLPELAGRILLAEDGPDNQTLFGFVLRKAGAEVEIAANGRAALDAWLRAEAAGRPFDLVLMDMHMPVLDGFEATRELRARGARIPIVALTAAAMTQDREACFAAGCDDFLAKPIHRQTLLEACSDALSGRVSGTGAGGSRDGEAEIASGPGIERGARSGAGLGR